jgi:hypothetical protein
MMTVQMAKKFRSMAKIGRISGSDQKMVLASLSMHLPKESIPMLTAIVDAVYAIPQEEIDAIAKKLEEE